MIVPALLTNEIKHLQNMLNVCAKFTRFAQIDIMDGFFVPSKSVSSQELRILNPTIGIEAHLMVNDPLEWIEPFKNLGASRILFHCEIKGNLEKIIDEIKARGLQAGIAVNPATKLEDFKNLIPKLDAVLFMSVVPGFYGAVFIPEVLDKIKIFRRRYPRAVIGIDGGVNYGNLMLIKASGVDYACVGSALMKAQDPVQAYTALEKKFNE